MPWFITSIATFSEDRSQRTFGFFNEYVDAYNAIIENRGDMRECLYNWIVLEYIEPGIHPSVRIHEWYAWDVITCRWTKMLNGPNEFANVTNFALG